MWKKKISKQRLLSLVSQSSTVFLLWHQPWKFSTTSRVQGCVVQQIVQSSTQYELWSPHQHHTKVVSKSWPKSKHWICKMHHSIFICLLDQGIPPSFKDLWFICREACTINVCHSFFPSPQLLLVPSSSAISNSLTLISWQLTLLSHNLPLPVSKEQVPFCYNLETASFTC